MADAVLVQQCAMWCRMKGLDTIPMAGETEALTRMAVADFKGSFAELNERQRRLIAGVTIL